MAQVSYKFKGTSTQVANSATAGTFAGFTLSPPLPAGFANGDFCELHVEADWAVVLPTPAGWIKQYEASPTAHTGAVFWRRLQTGDLTPDLNLTVPGRKDAIGFTISYNNVRATGDPYEAAAIVTGNTSPIPAASVITTGIERLAVTSTSLSDDLSNTPPAGWTELNEYVTGSGDDSGMAVQAIQCPTATTVTDNSRALGAGIGWTKISYALLPDDGSAAATSGAGPGSTMLPGVGSLLAGAGSVSATVTVANLVGAGSLLSGTATAVRNESATGATLIGAGSLLEGTATGIRSQTATGALLSGVATFQTGDADASAVGGALGDTLAAASMLLAGTATGQRQPTTSGDTVGSVSSFLAGTADGTRNGSASGEELAHVTTLITGTATGTQSATAAGVLFTAVGSLLASTAYVSGSAPGPGDNDHTEAGWMLNLGRMMNRK